MSSLRDLLSQDGFRTFPAATAAGRHRHPSPAATKPSSSLLCRKIDVSSSAAASPAAISILSGHLRQFSGDPSFRRQIHDRCSVCISPRRRNSVHPAIVNLDIAMTAIHKLADQRQLHCRRSLKKAGDLLSAVASLGSGKLRTGCSSGVPNLHLAAVARLYLAVAAALQENDGAAAAHLLQLFCDAPRLTRKALLPELWESFFLPHLLHLDLWFSEKRSAMKEDEEDEEEEEEGTKRLYRVYNDKMDLGTLQLAVHYKQRLPAGEDDGKAAGGGGAAATSARRSVSVPPSSDTPRRSQTDRISSSNSSCQTGIGESDSAPRNRSPFRFLSCRSDTNVVGRTRSPPRESNPNRETRIPAESIPRSAPDELYILGRAISSLSSSKSLRECELAVEAISSAWIRCAGDPAVEAAISTVPVTEGLLEVLFASKDEAISEIAMALMADLVARSDINRKAVLRADPQLETFLKLFRTRRLFLRAAVLLYLLRPRAKHMPSPEWIPLVLKVLEHGDKRQRLFSVECRPRSAAFYFLDQILNGFDADQNAENAKQVLALGGLEMLLRRFEEGDDRQVYSATCLLVACLRAEESCREFLAERLRKASLVELLAGNRVKSRECALSLLVELISVSRQTKVRSFLNDLKNEGCLNAMHILLGHLQRATSEQRPLAAAILLQIDLLLGDPQQYSVHREEAIDALVEAMDHSSRRKVQESCGRALSILCCRFSRRGEASMEAWLLRKSGFNGAAMDSDEITNQNEEEEAAMEDWRRRFSSILLRRGSERFTASLSDCMARGIPSLARSCLVMVAWMSISISPSLYRGPLWVEAWTPLIPALLDCLSGDHAMEERVLAAFSLRNLTRSSEFLLPKVLPLDRRSTALLHELAEVTWAAREILLVSASDPVSSARPRNLRKY